ncbi:MAG: NigD-like N-terminal domain-containing protein [Bacteroidaceae bacterium]|nr:NigD-like N-terminal domain-containing protein [Bacteroidaceae bacterium]
MNKIKLTWSMLLLTIASFVLPSCLDDEDEVVTSIYPNALVTLKTHPTEGFYLQLDDSTTLVPTNLTSSPYGDKEVRAFVNFTEESNNRSNRTYDVHVNWIDTIRTKAMDINLGEAGNVTTYGNDPVEIVNSWETVAEDGYLTLRFRTYFSMGVTHSLHLVKGENPYEVILHHNAYGDTYGKTADGIIAFRLNELPDTDEETVELTLKWNSFSGEKSAKFNYRPRP